MFEYSKRLTYMKSELLDLCTSSVNSQNRFHEFALLLQNYLEQHFHIHHCCFLFYDGEAALKPFYVHSSVQVDYQQMKKIYFNSFLSQQKVVDITDVEQGFPFNHMVFIKESHFDKYGVVFIQSSPEWLTFLQSDFFEDFINCISKVFYLINEQMEIRQNENQYRKLYNMTDLFHSTMDIDFILENMLITIQENFPNLDVELILSNDQDRQTKLQIKPFDYLSERPTTIQAFVSGEITIEQAFDLNRCLLNAPINGRQAIYGILQVSAPISYVFSNAQKDFIRLLAHTSGNALENAKLYRQSHRLIRDLQLINETSHHLNKLLTLNEMFLFLQKQVMQHFQPMELCFVLKEGNEYKITEATTDFFKTEESTVYIQHVVKHFESSQDSLFIADFSRIVGKEILFKSIMVIPMIVEQRINGFCIVLHHEPYFFSFDSFKLLQSLIHHSSLAIANLVLRNQLQEMVNQDYLTKLYARRYLDRFIERSLENDRSGMFLLIDIDNFKLINDTYGHQVGDDILVQIGNQLNKIIGTSGICARWGGEELAIYIPNISEDEAENIATELLRTIPQATNPTVTISAGLVFWNHEQRPDFHSIFLQADTALYNAKENGKNQVCVFNGSFPSHQ
ncbi:GGDEF domain-containing protein [Lysinibacillus halotolerans]